MTDSRNISGGRVLTSPVQRMIEEFKETWTKAVVA
jgi:hypothetical protein